MFAVRAVSFNAKGNVYRFLDQDGVERWPEHLMQYTGFRDRKRRKVYEGDIVQANGHSSTRTAVESQAYRWHPQLPKGTIYEVIGNVHEHPHLLANKKEI